MKPRRRQNVMFIQAQWGRSIWNIWSAQFKLPVWAPWPCRWELPLVWAEDSLKLRQCPPRTSSATLRLRPPAQLLWTRDSTLQVASTRISSFWFVCSLINCQCLKIEISQKYRDILLVFQKVKSESSTLGPEFWYNGLHRHADGFAGSCPTPKGHWVHAPALGPCLLNVWRLWSTEQ